MVLTKKVVDFIQEKNKLLFLSKEPDFVVGRCLWSIFSEFFKENNESLDKKPSVVSKWFSIFPHVEQEKKLTCLWNEEDNALFRPDHCTISDAMPPINEKYIPKQSSQTV